MKTPITYYGGKQRLAKKIVREIMQIPHTVYAEPFFGGGSVLYEKGYIDRGNGDYYREAINDHNKQLATFWQVVRENPDELIELINTTMYSQWDYDSADRIYKTPMQHTDLEVAWATFVLCNMSFSGRIDGGWRTKTTSDNPARTWANKKDRLPECFHRFRDVSIGCEDAIKFIQRWDSPHTLFYLDPPYPKANQGHYGGYTIEEFQELCDTLDTCLGSYILSNYQQDCEPKSATKKVQIEVLASSSMNKATRNEQDKRTEILWICDRSYGICDRLQAISRLGLEIGT
jgi:DNA adenine methylase